MNQIEKLRVSVPPWLKKISNILPVTFKTQNLPALHETLDPTIAPTHRWRIDSTLFSALWILAAHDCFPGFIVQGDTGPLLATGILFRVNVWRCWIWNLPEMVF